jgi:septum formation inhibitor-activating ATPase MinD
LLPNKKICQSKLRKVLKDIDKKQYGYLVFDGCPKGYANTRVRTGIFPEDETVITIISSYANSSVL